MYVCFWGDSLTVCRACSNVRFSPSDGWFYAMVTQEKRPGKDLRLCSGRSYFDRFLHLSATALVSTIYYLAHSSRDSCVWMLKQGWGVQHDSIAAITCYSPDGSLTWKDNWPGHMMDIIMLHSTGALGLLTIVHWHTGFLLSADSVRGRIEFLWHCVQGEQNMWYLPSALVAETTDIYRGGLAVSHVEWGSVVSSPMVRFCHKALSKFTTLLTYAGQ